MLVRSDLARRVGPQPQAAQLRDLLPEGHPAQQVGDPFLDGRAGTPPSLDVQGGGNPRVAQNTLGHESSVTLTNAAAAR